MSAATIDAESEVHQAVVDAIRVPMDALCTEVELCLRYFQVTFRGPPIERVLLAGPEATGWLAEYIQRRPRLPAEAADPFAGCVEVPESARERAARWSVACGLSLKQQEPVQEALRLPA
jgi:Tfp pilus assembly PilM family ATPase